MTKRKTNGYEAGKLASDIAYIKAGIIDLQEKFDGMMMWQTTVDVRSENNAVRIGTLEQTQTAQDKRMDNLSNWDKGIGILGGIGVLIASALGLRQS